MIRTMMKITSKAKNAPNITVSLMFGTRKQKKKNIDNMFHKMNFSSLKAIVKRHCLFLIQFLAHAFEFKP